MAHKFEPAENYMPSTDADWCSFRFCNKCKTLKKIWRNGVTYIANYSYLKRDNYLETDKAPECKPKTN